MRKRDIRAARLASAAMNWAETIPPEDLEDTSPHAENDDDGPAPAEQKQQRPPVSKSQWSFPVRE